MEKCSRYTTGRNLEAALSAFVGVTFSPRWCEQNGCEQNGCVPALRLGPDLVATRAHLAIFLSVFLSLSLTLSLSLQGSIEQRQTPPTRVGPVRNQRGLDALHTLFIFAGETCLTPAFPSARAGDGELQQAPPGERPGGRATHVRRLHAGCCPEPSTLNPEP